MTAACGVSRDGDLAGAAACRLLSEVQPWWPCFDSVVPSLEMPTEGVHSYAVGSPDMVCWYCIRYVLCIFQSSNGGKCVGMNVYGSCNGIHMVCLFFDRGIAVDALEQCSNVVSHCYSRVLHYIRRNAV